MPKVQQSFSAGEISPNLYARTDFQKYQSAAKKLRNFLCLSQGGIQNRAGTYFINEVKTSSKRHRLIPFQFSVEQAYALEFGEYTMRVYMDGGIVEDGGTPVEIVTPYDSGSLPSLYYTQKIDVLYLFHPDYPTRKLSRTSHIAWTLEIAPFTDGPYMSQTLADLDITLTPAARSGNNIAITASSSFFTAAMVGTPLRLGYLNPNNTAETVWGYGVIDQVTDDLNARIDINADNPFGYEYLDNPTFDVGIGFWGDYSTSPSVLTYDTINKSAVLTKEATGDAEMRQEIGVTPNETCTLTVDIQKDDIDSLATNPFDTVNGSNTVTVNHVAHGLITGNNIYIAGVAVPVNGIPASEFNNTLAITKVNDDSYTVVVVTSATSTGSGGGSGITAQRNLGTVRIAVGTTNGGTEVLPWQSETTVGVKTYTVTPTVQTIYVTIDNAGSASGNRGLLAEVRFSRQQLGTSDWRKAAWNSDNGYPAVATFYEQRLITGSTYEQPLNLWATKPASEDFGFKTPSADDDGLNIPLSSQQQNGIKWLKELGALVVGGTGAEFRVEGASGAALTPTTLLAKARSYHGSAALPALVVGNEILFAVRVGSEVRTLQYDEVSGNLGQEISILANHLLEGLSISEWGVARTPNQHIWIVRSDGKLLTITYNKEQEIVAWGQHETDGTFESVCAIPTATVDGVYFIVKRTIDGQTKRYVEQLMPRITDEDTYDFFFVDSGLTYSGVPQDSFAGLDHLEGKTVSVLADGVVYLNKTVTNGIVNIDSEASLVHIGLAYNSDVETLNLEYAGNNGGSTQGKHKTVAAVNLQVNKSRGCFIGSDSANLYEVKFPESVEPYEPYPLFSGVLEARPVFGVEKEQTVYIRQPYPLPLEILAIMPEVQVNDR